MARYPYYYWTETNTNFTCGTTDDLLTTPIDQDLHIPLRSSSDAVVRSEWFPRVDVQSNRTSGAPTPYWWVGSTVNLVVVWDPDSSFPFVNIQEGAADTRTMGTVSLNPVPHVYDSSFDEAVTYQCPQQGLILHTGRKGIGGDVTPTVHGQVWAFDNYGVFDGSAGTHVVRKLSMISRVLWGTHVPPP